MSRTEKLARAAVAGACIFETVAIETGKVPTISTICRKHKSLALGLAAAWLLHIFTPWLY